MDDRGVKGMHDRGMGTLARAVRNHTLVMPVSGSTVTLQAGDTLEVQLRQLGGSGAAWRVTHLPAGLALEGDEHFGPGRHVTGAFSTRLFRFRALSPGRCRLQLTIGREDAAEPHGWLDVSVIVDR